MSESDNNEPLGFVIPTGTPFPKFMVNPTTGKLDFEQAPIDVIRAANPSVDFSERWFLLYFLLGWYEIERQKGYRDPLAEVVRERTQAADAHKDTIEVLPNRH